MSNLTVGETNLVVRALRYYINGEQRAIQEAVCKARASPKSVKFAGYARDITEQATAHIDAANNLIEKLRPNFKEPHA